MSRNSYSFVFDPKYWLARSQMTQCACQQERNRLFASQLACLPGRIKATPQELKDLYKKIIAGDFTLKEAWKGGIFSVRVVLLFFIGEVIGRGHLIGYSAGNKDSPFMKKQRGEIKEHH